MKIRLILYIAFIFGAVLLISTQAWAQEFNTRQIADRIYAVSNSENSDEQVVIASEKGLVVLNSFWSEIIARRFKEEIIKALKRDDFIYLIDMTDRLDMFGGNAAYKDIPIIGHKAFWDKYRGKEAAVNAEIDRLIKMWREKEEVSLQRLAGYEPGSNDALSEQQWANTCRSRADELEAGFTLVVPTEIYEDRRSLDLGDLTLNLIWFGRAGYDGSTVITIPELKLAIIPGFILHSQHLAPYPRPDCTRLDVPRWIQVLEEILEGDNAVDNILCGTNMTDIFSKDRALTHLHYIRELWNAVTKAEAEGKDLPELYDQLSLEKEFAFVKEMPAYKNGSDEWFRPQHNTHIRLFFLQHKENALEIIKNMGDDSLTAALDKIRKLQNDGGDIYVEEASINNIGYALLNKEKYADAIEVFRFNIETYPQSANAYDSYAEALMKSGDIENAAANYRKSLELNPDNANAREMLKNLE